METPLSFESGVKREETVIISERAVKNVLYDEMMLIALKKGIAKALLCYMEKVDSSTFLDTCFDMEKKLRKYVSLINYSKTIKKAKKEKRVELEAAREVELVKEDGKDVFEKIENEN